MNLQTQKLATAEGATSTANTGQISSNQPRQSSQIRNKAIAASTINGQQRIASAAFSSSHKPGNFSHNLNLYSNYLMNQQATVLSPTQAVYTKVQVNPASITQLPLSSTNNSQALPNNVSVRVKKFKTSSRGFQQQHTQEEQQQNSLREKLLDQPHRVLPGTAASKTRQQLTKISSNPNATLQVVDKVQLFNQMPQMVKTKSGGAGSKGQTANRGTNQAISNNQLQAVNTTSTANEKVHSKATSPDSTVICFKTIPVSNPKSKQDEAIKLIGDDDASFVDQVYLIGGNSDKRTNIQGTQNRQTKTIFDYNTPQQSAPVGNQASQGNFVFQPLLKSPPTKAPSTFKSQRTSKGAASKQSMVSKDGKPKIASGRGSSNKKRSTSRKDSLNINTNATPTSKAIEIANPASFYQQITSRNQTTQRAFSSSRESLKAQIASQTVGKVPKPWEKKPQQFYKTQMQPMIIMGEDGKSGQLAIHDYMMQTTSSATNQFSPKDGPTTPGSKVMMSMKNLTTPLDTGIQVDVNQRMQSEIAAMIAQRNLQKENQKTRTTLKNNNNNNNNPQQQSSRQKFVKRQFVPHVRSGAQSHISTGQGTGKRSKNQSRSPSVLQLTNTTIKQKNGVSAAVDNCQNQDLNLTVVQTEELNPAPRETYTGHPVGVLTPELLYSSSNKDQAEIFYRSPNQKAMMLKDQQQTYFTSDSNEKIALVQNTADPRRKNGSFALQGSPRATYYSPKRNSSISKNMWLNDTIPVSPQRQILTPQTLNPQQNTTRQLKKMVGVTQLGTSYDFNKLKKGLDQVQNRNNQSSTQNHPMGGGGVLSKPNNTSSQQMLKAKELSEVAKIEEPIKLQQDIQVENSLPARTEEEVIVFSENHSLDDYIIGKQIGQGAYATVHIGMHKKYNKKVALKIYLKEKMKDLQRKKSVRREIKLMRRLDHPNIAKLYDAIETETKVIIVMEYVGGGSTHGFLKSKHNRQMEESEAKKIFSQLISALNYLHQKCIAHRDIKLENVMLDHRGDVKLIDFGFSTQIPNTQKIKLFCGTPSYMAPEIVKKIEFCGPPADIYASGVLLFAFFCGCFPFRGKDDKDLYKKIANDELLIPDHVPETPRNIIQRMLQKTPETRPTAQDLYKESWVQSYFNQSDLQGMLRQQTRSNSIKRRSELPKPCSPSYIPGEKVMTPLSDHKAFNQQIVPGIVYDQQLAQQRVKTNQRLVQTADQPTRPNKAGTIYTARAATLRDHIIQSNNLYTRGADGGSASARGYSQQRINKKRQDYGLHNFLAPFKHEPQTNNLIGELNMIKQQQRETNIDLEQSEIPFIVTKHGGQTVTYGGRSSNKPSTPVNIGRYYLAGSSNTFGSGAQQSQRTMPKGGLSKLQENTDRVTMAQTEPNGQKQVQTVRNHRLDLVVDKNEMILVQPPALNTTRGDNTNRCFIANSPNSPMAHNSPKNASQPNTTKSHLSPNSDRFPTRKQSVPGIYNSEAYKAYYTHSAAASSGAHGASPIPVTDASEFHQQQQSPQTVIAQEGPLLAGPIGASVLNNAHQVKIQKGSQTINNNINIINYITTIACSHPSHTTAEHCDQSKGPNQKPPGKQIEKPVVKTVVGANSNNNQMVTPVDARGGVYSPTGKAMPANLGLSKQTKAAPLQSPLQ